MASSLEQQIEQYQSFLDSYKSKQTDAKDKPVDFKVAKTVAATAMTPFDQKQSAARVFDQIQNAKTAFNKPPKYFKPAFLLESLTPRVHAAIYLQKFNKDSHSGIEKYDLFSQTTAPTLTNPDPQPVHNYIKSFTYNVFGDADSQSATLEIIDIDNSLIEAMVLRFQTLSLAIGGAANPDDANIMIEVEYGWSVPPALEERYSRLGNGAEVKFTNTVLFVLKKPEMKFNMDGTINCIFHLQANGNLVPPFIWWTPFRELGTKYPLLPLATDNILLNMFSMRKKYTNDKEFIKRFGTWFYLEMSAGSENVTDIHLFIDSVREIFGINSEDTKPSNILSKKYLLDEANAYFGKTETTVISTGKVKQRKAIPGAVISTAELLKQSLGTINNSNIILNLKSNEWFEKIKLTDITMPESVKTKHLNSMLFPADGAMPTSFEKMIRYTEALDKESKTNGAKLKTFKSWKNFLDKMGAFALNWYVHPLVAEIYITEKFFAALDKYDSSNPNEVKVVYSSMIKNDDIQPRGYYSQLLKGDMGTFSRIEKEQWCKKINTYSLTSSTPWIDFIQDMMTAQKFNFEPVDTQSAKLLGGQDIEKNDAYKKTIAKGKEVGTIPAQVQSNSFITTSKGAKQNLEIMLKLLKISKNTLTLTSDQKEDLTKRIGLIQDFKTQAEKTMNDTMIKWIFLIKDQMPGGGIYDPSHGESSILQAYSYRGHNTPDQTDAQWNPGYPSCWDINFMDILSFEPEFDYYSAQTAISNNMVPLKISEGSTKYVDTDVKTLADNEAEFKKISTVLETKGSKKEEQTAAVQELQTLITKMLEQKNQSMIKQRVGAYPVTFNMDFQRGTANNGSLPEVLEAKKHIQQFRNRLMTEVLNVSAKQTVIGDPSYQFNDAMKYIFNKVINSDGSLSIFTGLYRIKSCIQTIANGSFVTNLELLQDATTDAYVAESMFEGIYNNDKMINKNSIL